MGGAKAASEFDSCVGGWDVEQSSSDINHPPNFYQLYALSPCYALCSAHTLECPNKVRKVLKILFHIIKVIATLYLLSFHLQISSASFIINLNPIAYIILNFFFLTKSKSSNGKLLLQRRVTEKFYSESLNIPISRWSGLLITLFL